MKKNRKILFVLGTIILLGVSGCKVKDDGISENETENEKEVVLTIESNQKEDNEENEVTQFEENKMVIENQSLEIQNLAPYSGNDFQEGKIIEVSDVYAVKITNLTKELMKEASLVFNDGEQELVFSVSFLPPGESTIVVEDEQKKGSSANLIYVEGEIEYLSDTENAVNSVAITFEEDKAVNVNNMLNEDISLLWLICKPFNDQDETYGSAYIIPVDSLEEGGEQRIETELSEGNYQIIWAQRIE